MYASDTWDDDWWWSTWDEGWSDAWTDTSWSVVPAPVEKATPLAAPAAPEPKATSGAAVSAVTLEPVPPSKAKAKATSKVPAKASGLALPAVTLGSMFAGTSFCFVVPHVMMCHLVACLKVVWTLMTFRLWLGHDTESNQHFVATSQGVHKTRSLRRRPPSEQVQKDLLESLQAKPALSVPEIAAT